MNNDRTLIIRKLWKCFDSTTYVLFNKPLHIALPVAQINTVSKSQLDSAACTMWFVILDQYWRYRAIFKHSYNFSTKINIYIMSYFLLSGYILFLPDKDQKLVNALCFLRRLSRPVLTLNIYICFWVCRPSAIAENINFRRFLTMSGCHLQ